MAVSVGGGGDWGGTGVSRCPPPGRRPPREAAPLPLPGRDTQRTRPRSPCPPNARGGEAPRTRRGPLVAARLDENKREKVTGGAQRVPPPPHAKSIIRPTHPTTPSPRDRLTAAPQRTTTSPPAATVAATTTTPTPHAARCTSSTAQCALSFTKLGHPRRRHRWGTTASPHHKGPPRGRPQKKKKKHNTAATPSPRQPYTPPAGRRAPHRGETLLKTRATRQQPAPFGTRAATPSSTRTRRRRRHRRSPPCTP